MGQSTDAFLAFGIDLGDEVEWPAYLTDGDEDSDYPDLAVYLGKKAGLADDAYAEQWALERAYPLDLVRHCSGDYPMWFLALRDTVVRASSGDPKPAAMREITDEDRALIKAFCEEHGLAWEEPDWMIFSDRG